MSEEDNMKKIKTSENQDAGQRQKLNLKKVTLRDLDEPVLEAIAGAATAATVCAPTCHTVCSTLCHTC
jgi:hypothetical protein